MDRFGLNLLISDLINFSTLTLPMDLRLSMNDPKRFFSGSGLIRTCGFLDTALLARSSFLTDFIKSFHILKSPLNPIVSSFQKRLASLQNPEAKYYGCCISTLTRFVFISAKEKRPAVIKITLFLKFSQRGDGSLFPKIW